MDLAHAKHRLKRTVARPSEDQRSLSFLDEEVGGITLRALSLDRPV